MDEEIFILSYIFFDIFIVQLKNDWKESIESESPGKGTYACELVS